MHSQWHAPSYKFIESNARSEMPSIHHRHDVVKPFVAWRDSAKPSLAYPQPPPRELMKTEHQMLASRAARNYINYCNGINNSSRPVFQRNTCSSLHRPLAHEVAKEPCSIHRSSLHHEMHSCMTPVDEDQLRETILMERTANKCCCPSCSQNKSILKYSATRPQTPSGHDLDLVRSRSRLGSGYHWAKKVPGEEITGIDIRPCTAKQPHQPLAHGDVTNATRATSVTVCEVTKTDQLNERRAAAEAAKQALMAIYQAGKADGRFHVRAPSTAVLKSMLDMLSNDASGTTGEQADDWMHSSGKEGRYLGQSANYGPVKPVTTVADAMEPVRVHMEFPPNTDTAVSFRLRSRPT